MESVLKKRKGSTLVELSVVIAMVAIISAIVVSFSVSVNNKVTVTNAKLNANSDLALIETIVETWITKQTENKALFYISESEDDKIFAKVEETEYLLSFKDGMLTGMMSNSETLSCNTETVKSVKFDFISKSFNGESETKNQSANSAEYDILFYCTVNYTLSYKEEINSYVFCVNPHVGEIF